MGSTPASVGAKEAQGLHVLGYLAAAGALLDILGIEVYLDPVLRCRIVAVGHRGQSCSGLVAAGTVTEVT